MGERFPSMKASDLEAIVARHCTFDRQKGSHRHYRNREGSRVTIAFHAGETIAGGLVRRLLTGDVLLSIDEAKREVGM